MIKIVLIVDDSEGDHFYNEVIIASYNDQIKILKAYDGEEALELVDGIETADEELPDLILLDVNMPRMDGHEFLRKYSLNNQRKIPVVVMLTSSDQEKDKEQALVYDCVKDYLMKPITLEKVEELNALVVDVKNEA